MNNNQQGNDWFKKGNSLYEAKRFEEAIRCYDQAVKFDPSNVRIWNNRGLSFDGLGRHEEAIFCYTKALEINPKYVAGWCNRGISLNALRRYKDAIQCFKKALELDAKHAIIWQSMGDSLRNLGSHKEAIFCYSKTLEFDNRNALAMYNKALCEDALGLRKAAYSSYSMFDLLARGIDSVITDGGRPAVEIKYFEPAKVPEEFIDHASKRIGELKDSPDLSNENQEKSAATADTTPGLPPVRPLNTPPSPIGNTTHSEVNQPTSSTDPELYQDDANHWYLKGKELFDRESYETALRCFDNALALEPEYAYAWYKKAECEEHLGRKSDAWESFRRVVRYADDELNIIQSAKQRMRALESNEKSAANLQKISRDREPKADQEITNLPAWAPYKPGDIIGQRYKIQRILGMGGFGIVYLASYSEADETWVFALKTFRDEFITNADVRERFRKEATLWVEMDFHPYLVQDFLVEEFSGRLYIVMEYIAPNMYGLNSLAGYLESRPPDLAQSLRWAIQVCHGMEYVCSKGIRAHRDLKPENIMISQDGRALITDFGLAGISNPVQAESGDAQTNKEREGQPGQTQMGIGFGTPTHMPPEQFDDPASCDQRSDIYSIGVILFQMASGGYLPFLADPPRNNSEDESIRFIQVMRRLHYEAPVPQLDSPLFPIIQRCLEKEPNRRYQRFEQLRSELETLLKRRTGEIIQPPLLGEIEPWEWINKGVSLQNLGRYEEAIRCYDKALELDPRYTSAWINKGNSLDSLRSYNEAIRCYDKALELDPRNACAWGNKGISLKNLGGYNEAIRCYDEALEIDPRNANFWNNKGDSLDNLERIEEAIRCYDKALELDPCDTSAWTNKGNSLGSLGSYEEAIRYFDKALELDPRNTSAWNNKGTSSLSIML